MFVRIISDCLKNPVFKCDQVSYEDGSVIVMGNFNAEFLDFANVLFEDEDTSVSRGEVEGGFTDFYKSAIARGANRFQFFTRDGADTGVIFLKKKRGGVSSTDVISDFWLSGSFDLEVLDEPPETPN